MKQNGWAGVLVLVVLGGLAVATIYYGLSHLDISSPASISTLPTTTTEPAREPATLTPAPAYSPASSSPEATLSSAPTNAPTATASSSNLPKGKKDSGPPITTGG